MRIAILTIALSLFWVAQSNAQTVDAEVDIKVGIKLESPVTCEVGELVRFDARGSVVDSLVWDILPGTDDFEVVGNRAFFSARGGGEYLVLIAGAKDGQAFLRYQKLIVEGVAVPTTGITRKVGDWLRLVANVPNRETRLKAMAGVFRKLSEKPVTPDKMVEATALANSAVLGDDLKLWIPFLDKLGTELDELVDADQLETVDQYQKTWSEIANALTANADKKQG